MNTMKKTLKGSLVGLTLLQSLNASAYFDKAQYLDDSSAFMTGSVKKSLLTEDPSQKASQDSIERILGYVMANINKDATTYGPVYRHKSRNTEKYGDEVVKIILNEAHNLASKYINEGNTEAYFAFLTLALTVPNQEGLFVHFREVEANRDNCNDERANGEKIKSEKAMKQFQMALNAKKVKKSIFGREKLVDDDSREAFLVDCKELRGANSYKQLIVGGSDGSDVGMFQLSALWHFEEYLNQGKYDSVKQTVQYGLRYLRNQFNSALRQATPDKLSCMIGADGQIDYSNLIRGSWSAYNGGPSQKCRFADTESPYAGHDNGFKKNLQITLNLNNGGFFGFADDSTLELSSETRAAVEEVVTNFENKTNNTSALNKILN